MRSINLEEAKTVITVQTNDIQIYYGMVLTLVNFITTILAWVNWIALAGLSALMIFDTTFATKYYKIFLAFVAVFIAETIGEHFAKIKINKNYTAILYNSTKNIVEHVDEYERLDDDQKVEFFNIHFSDIIGMEETKTYKEI